VTLASILRVYEGNALDTLSSTVVAEEVILGSLWLKVIQQSLIDDHFRVQLALFRELPNHPSEVPVGYLVEENRRILSDNVYGKETILSISLPPSSGQLTVAKVKSF